MLKHIAPLLLTITSISALADEQQNCRELRDTFACNLEIISGVTLETEGTILNEHKEHLVDFISLRIRNDLSMLKLESPLDFLRLPGGFDAHVKALRNRGRMECFAWAEKANAGIIYYTECELIGSSKYFSVLSTDSFKARTLGQAEPSKFIASINDGFEEIIKNISIEYLKTMDREEKLTSSPSDSQLNDTAEVLSNRDAEQEAIFARNCKIAQENLQLLLSSNDLQIVGDDGSAKVLGDDLRSDHIEQTRRDIKYFCRQ